jgi:hypothetical protein
VSEPFAASPLDNAHPLRSWASIFALFWVICWVSSQFLIVALLLHGFADSFAT